MFPLLLLTKIVYHLELTDPQSHHHLDKATLKGEWDLPQEHLHELVDA